jgi:hypothetical protein
VLTDRGKAIVRAFEDTFDAQTVYQKLVEHHLRSTKAMLESSTILSYITSVRLGNGEWTGTTEGFIIHWTNQVRLYERQVPSSDHFSDGQKRIMLENAVHPVTELRQVKNTADLEKTKTGKSLSYDEYLNLLLSAAAAHDNQFAAKKNKRQVFIHDHYEPNDTDDADETYDIDAPVSLLLANATDRHNKSFNKNQPSVQMPRDRWFNLDQQSKDVWDRLDDKAKSIILGYDPNKPKPNTPFTSFKSSNTQRRVNLHEMSAFDFVQAYIHETSQANESDRPDTIDNADTIGTATAENNTTMLVNAAKSSNNAKLPPGDVRRVMSKSSTRFINKVEYHISKHQSTNCSFSLVDRGANGGVAGDDVRLIFKTNRTVDI